MDVVIHIGQEKTATTTLQAHLVAARAELETRGVRYSGAFGSRKARLLADLVRKRAREEDDLARKLANFSNELRGAWRTLIVSQEELFTLKPGAMQRLRDLVTAEGGAPRVYAYVRRPDEHLVSLHQLRVRGFGTQSIEDYAKAQLAAGYYHYKRTFDRWSQVFGRDAVHVRLFHPSTLNASPAQDFLSWIGLDPADFPTIGALAADRHNESLDPVSVELLRLLSRYYVSHAADLSEHFMLSFREQAQHLDSGARSRWIPSAVGPLLDGIRQDSEGFAAEYLTAEEATLFLAPSSASEARPPVDGAAVLARAVEALARLEPVWRLDGRKPPADRLSSSPAHAILGASLAKAELTPDGAALVAELELGGSAASGDCGRDTVVGDDLFACLIDRARSIGFSPGATFGNLSPARIRATALLLDQRRQEAARAATRSAQRVKPAGSASAQPR